MSIRKRLQNLIARAILPEQYLDAYLKRSDLYERFLTAQHDFQLTKTLIEGNAFFKPRRIEILKHPNAQNILVLSPHQDYEIIGCGCTILNSVASSLQVNIVYIMDGCSPKLSEDDRTKYLSLRNQEATKIWSEISSNNPYFLNTPTRGNNIDCNIVSDKITKIIETINPDCLFVPYFLESPLDHRRASYLAWQALNKSNDHIKEVWLYQVNTMISPNIAVDITGVESEKFRLMNMWTSQNEKFNYAHRTRGLNAANSVFVAGTPNLPKNPYIEVFHVTSKTNFLRLLKPYYENSLLF